MTTSSNFRSEDVKTESSWAGPARILFITLILAGGFVYYYFGPSVEDIQGNNPKASTSREPVSVTIAGEALSIPQNYTQFVKTRRGGNQDAVDLYAILPDFDGFTIAHQVDFEGNSPSSPIVHLKLQDINAPSMRMNNEPLTHRMTEREKFERIFLPLIVNPKGEQARYGFTRYRLSEKWAQKDEDLFVHEASDGGIILYRCLQQVETMPSPWCRRDFMLTDRLIVTYRFKRSRLGDWRDIDRGVARLIDRFRHGTPVAPQTAPAPAPQKEAAPPAAQAARPLEAAPPPAAETDQFDLVPKVSEQDPSAMGIAPQTETAGPAGTGEPDAAAAGVAEQAPSAPATAGTTPPPVPPPANGGY